MIRERLLLLKDEGYREFSAKLIPTVDRERIIGVRAPEIRKLAKSLSKEEKEAYISALPHKYLEEDMLHVCILNGEKDLDKLYEKLAEFLPLIDNWASCDSLSPKAIAKDMKRLEANIIKWLASDKTYTVRFGLGMLMGFCLGEGFKEEHLHWAADLKPGDYYIDMMRAWYFATALAKQYDSAFKIVEEKTLDKFTQNKTISKAVESYRVTDEHKEELRRYRIK